MYQGSGGTAVVGDNVKWVHQYVDFSSYIFTDTDGTQKSTCKAALGYSFAAGTTDGPGQFDFTQNERDPPKDPLWNIVRDILKAPSAEQVACHKPKAYPSQRRRDVPTLPVDPQHCREPGMFEQSCFRS